MGVTPIPGNPHPPPERARSPGNIWRCVRIVVNFCRKSGRLKKCGLSLCASSISTLYTHTMWGTEQVPLSNGHPINLIYGILWASNKRDSQAGGDDGGVGCGWLMVKRLVDGQTPATGLIATSDLSRGWRCVLHTVCVCRMRLSRTKSNTPFCFTENLVI